MSYPRIAAAVCACLLLVGCADGDSSGTDGQDQALDNAVGATIDQPRVTLKEPGQDPKVVRFDVANVDTSRVLVTATAFAQEVGGDPSLPAPDSGERELKVNRERQVLHFVMPDGFRATWMDVDDTGRYSAVAFRAPEDAPDEQRVADEKAMKLLMAMPVILPTDAVGVGGSWSVDSRVAGDSTLLQTTTYTVTAMDDEGMDVDVAVVQRPAVTSVGDELDVLDSSSESSGSMRIDFAQPVPRWMSVDVSTRVVYGKRGADDKLNVVQDMTTHVGLK